MEVGSANSAMEAMLRRSQQIQGQVMMNLINVLKQAEITHAKPLMNISSGGGQVDITV